MFAVRFLKCLLFFISLNLIVAGQGNSDIETLIAPSSKVKIGKLPNGFTYYIQKNKKPANRVVFYLANKVGSVLETEEQRGLAHLLEHMCFNGTKNFPKNELVNYLQKAGVRFGADLNATTGFDETIYQLPVQSDDKEVLRNAIQILRDWAQDVTLDGEEIDKERGVVLEEKRQRLGSSQRVQDKLMPVLVNNSRYASRLPIGTEEVLKNFSHETLRQFYRDWYRPDLQALVVVGDIDVKAVEKMIVSKFSDLKSPASKPERTEYNIPLLNKNQFFSVTDDEAAGADITIHLKHQAGNLRTEEDFKQSMLKSLFNQMLAGRFSELYQQENIPFVGISGSITKLIGNLGSFTFSVQPKPGEYEKAFKVLWTEIERIKRFGFLPSELERAKTNFITSYESANKERDNTPSDSYVREYVRNFFTGEAIPGIEFEYEFYKKNVPAVTINNLSSLFRQFFTETNRDIIVTANTKDKDLLPSENVILQWMKDTEHATVGAYIDKEDNDELLSSLPTAGSIVSEKKLWGKAGITELILNNGVRVLLKPTDFKKDEIRFSAVSAGGASLIDDSNFHAAGFATAVIGASGIGNFNTTALQKKLTGKKVGISPLISAVSEGFAGSSSPEDFETALQLLYLYFTKPRKDPVIFNSLKERFSINYNNAKDLPGTIFGDTIASVSSGYHYRNRRATPAEIDKIELDKVIEIYKDRFSDAGDFTFVFAGSFEIEKVKPLIARYLGSLPGFGRKEEPKNLKQDIAKGIHSRKIFKGKEQQARVVLMLGGEYAPDATTNAQLSTLAAVLRIRLLERLREQESGVYSVSADTRLRKRPSGEYVININFICDPKNVELLILSVFSEIGKIKREGALQEDIDKIRAAAKQQKPRVLKENGFWLSHISTNVMEKTEDEIENIFDDSQWKKITPESLQATAKKYLNGENYMRFVLLPDVTVK